MHRLKLALSLGAALALSDHDGLPRPSMSDLTP
jgi:hypothetical protein